MKTFLATTVAWYTLNAAIVAVPTLTTINNESPWPVYITSKELTKEFEKCSLVKKGFEPAINGFNQIDIGQLIVPNKTNPISIILKGVDLSGHTFTKASAILYIEAGKIILKGDQVVNKTKSTSKALQIHIDSNGTIILEEKSS